MNDDHAPVVALTMTPEAAGHFRAALLHAAVRIPQTRAKSADDPMDHADWLQWGASRLTAAVDALSTSQRDRQEASDGA